MADWHWITTWIALARAAHFSACLALMGGWAFDRLVIAPAASRTREGFLEGWSRALAWLTSATLLAALLSGVLWFWLIATDLSDSPWSSSLSAEILGPACHTHFGHLLLLRLGVWLLAAALAAATTLSGRARSGLAWAMLLAAAALTASLASAGHGPIAAGGAFSGASSVHFAADALHLLAAGCWPAGLLPLAIVFLQARRGPGDARRDHPILALAARRFSSLSLVIVAALLLTGLLNSWFLLGPIGNLATTPYGRVLLFKLLLFGCLLWLGAVNRWRWTPLLPVDDNAAGRLLRNVLAELAIAAAVVAVVGVLGLLPPAVA